MNGEIRVFSGPDAVAEEAAKRTVAMMGERPHERFSLALSGGSTPQKFYRLLAESPWRERIDWNSLHIFLADERFLPSNHPDSNFRMIREILLEPISRRGGAETGAPPEEGMPAGLLAGVNVHPMPVDGTAEGCAERYEAELRSYFGDTPPCFDLIVLGMGPDGHTASLFPGQTHPQGRWVVPVHESPKPPATRLSLSLELINQARHVLFLVTGRDKAEALAVLRETGEPVFPAGRVKLNQGELVWLVDEAAWGLRGGIN